MIRVALAQTIHFVLRKNYLASVKIADVVRLAQDVAGLAGDPAATPFLAAHARLTNFIPKDLSTELSHNRTLIKNSLMRGADYIVPAENYITLHAATARQRKQSFNSEFRQWGLENKEIETLAAAILEVIDEHKPATVETITAYLPQNLVKELTQTSRGGRVARASNLNLILRWLTAEGKLYAGQNVRSDFEEINSENLVYAPLSYWYPNLDLSSGPAEAEAQAAMVRAYLAAFGPATEADISFWSGFGKSETARAVSTLAAETTLTLVEGLPGMLLLLKDQAEALRAVQAPQSPVINILPANDIFITAHRASQARLFGAQNLRRYIFSSSGAAQPTIVINGQIVGSWNWQQRAHAQDQITWRLLTEVDARLLPLIRAEIERTASFIRPEISIFQEID